MAEQPNWLDDALARAKASAGTAAAPPSVMPVSFAPAVTDVGDEPVRSARKGSLPIILASTGAGLLVAAACVFALRSRAPQPAVAPLPQVAAAVARAEAPAIPPPPAETAPAALPGVAQVTEAPAAAAPAAAHVAESEGPPVGRHWRHERHEARAAESHVAPVAAKAAEAPAPPPVHAAAPPPPPAPKSALDAALRASVGNAAAQAPAAPAPEPAAAAPAPRAPAGDGVPERPSGSAVTSTLTEVLGKARKCVEGMSDASRALVTFGSDGAAHKIDVTGPAANDPKAMQCLKAAFSRAHVPPFSSANYSAGVTIRPQ
jgi:2-oxoglutarate dehydrogenase E2 component (dihydrolipoamide succinyltransferase)